MVFIAACLIGVSIFGLVWSTQHDVPRWAIAYLAALGIFGLALVPLRLLRVRAQRRNTRYVLTDQRALIMRLRHKNQLHAYPFAETNRLKLSHYSGGLSILIIKEESMARQIVKIGVEFIPDGQVVYDRREALSAGKRG